MKMPIPTTSFCEDVEQSGTACAESAKLKKAAI